MAQVLDADFLSQVRDVDSLSRGVRSMFYFVTPNESSFQHVEEVPLYVQQASPFFIALVLLETLVGWLKRGVPVGTISDGLTSIFAGMVSRLPALLMRGVELTSYIYVWDHYHLFELPWDSAWTWCFTFLGVDFCYYWVHRFAHEVALFWAAHQVHHSSEYFNLPTALRQSLTQQYSSWIFYLPLALAVPPSVFAVHIQFNLLYQFWIHTEVIGNLGPLEFILNTPSHHRVHHGRNLYCIDKNYGGALIIWDRLFGTFAPETDKVVYGLVFPIRTFETFEIQFGYYLYLWRKSRNYETIIHKLSTFLKGPSWSPGKRRLGDHEEVPTVTGEEIPLKSSCPMTLQIYVVVHFVLVLGLYHDVFESKMILSQVNILAMISYILLTLTSMGFIIDQRPRAAILEMMRCVVMVMMQHYGYMKPLLPSLLPSLAVLTKAFVFLSLLYWVVQSFSQLSTSRCFTGACRLFSQLSPSRCFTGACRLCRASLSWIASQLDSFSQLVNIKKSN